MWQIAERRALTVGLFAAALLLSLTGLAWGADQIESPANETTAGSTLGPPEQIVDAPALAPTTSPSWRGNLRTRSQLTGNWGGSRDALAANGFTFFGDLTQYYQGVASGGLEQQFRYGGRGDYLLDIDSQKMGRWAGGHLDLRGETRLPCLK